MEEILPQFIPWWHWQADWNRMTASLSARACVFFCVCVLGVRGREVWVSIRVSDLHKDFPLWLETFCQADRSVYRIGHYARLPRQYETGAMVKTSLSLCWVVRTVCAFFVGQCLCGQCTCHPPGDTRIHGKICECDDRQCENMSGEVCGGESAQARAHMRPHTHTQSNCVSKNSNSRWNRINMATRITHWVQTLFKVQ